jgi:hypothetical protein
MQLPGEPRPGNVGPPLPCCFYKLADVPELNLMVNRDGKGEVGWPFKCENIFDKFRLKYFNQIKIIGAEIALYRRGLYR